MPSQQMLYEGAQSEKGGKKIYMFSTPMTMQYSANQSYQGNYPYSQ